MGFVVEGGLASLKGIVCAMCIHGIGVMGLLRALYSQVCILFPLPWVHCNYVDVMGIFWVLVSLDIVFHVKFVAIVV